MVAERGRGEGGRGDGGGSSGRRRRRRRRVPALVAPTEGGGHRDPGAAADRDGREKDERAEERLSSPRRCRDVLEGEGRSERKRLGSAPVPRQGASAESSCAASTHHSKWQRLSHTGAARPAPRMRALPARTKRSGPRGGAREGEENIMLCSRRESSAITSLDIGAPFLTRHRGEGNNVGASSRPHHAEN